MFIKALFIRFESEINITFENLVAVSNVVILGILGGGGVTPLVNFVATFIEI
jgi:hypothetical protein